jgi:hypothetical protein
MVALEGAPVAATSFGGGLAIRQRESVAGRRLTDAALRWTDPLSIGLTALLAAVAVFLLWTLLTDPAYASMLGNDREIYASALARWNHGQGFYLPDQLLGSYEIQTGHILYPPIALPAFELIMAIPAVLYWAIPLAIVAATVALHRPARWAWPVLAACCAFPWTPMLLVAGNPSLWITAAVAAGTVLGWPAILVLIKPSLFPFAVIGIHHRSWWLAAAGVICVALAFGPMWVDWAQVVMNASGWRAGPLYSLGDAPMLAIPVVAWLARRRAPVLATNSSTVSTERP